ncbi:MAG: hypothetical protein A2542_02370 [Parcubacteria group bacterium RIFOXYD2_FULL_52_8]|nr:MAG: hypothetical protein A2542_02370 [Parcubacteria group bacterium RIFOXYD2_FULL_52_8]
MKFLLVAHEVPEAEFEQALLEMVGDRSNLKMALIPTASDPIEWIPDAHDPKKANPRLVPEKQAKQEAWWNNYKKELEAKGWQVVIADLKEDPAVLKEKLASVDVINVGGGDVNYLLEWARKSKLETYLAELLDRGVVYTGSSAGAMLPQPDIGFTWWEPGDPSDHVGLGIVDFITAGAPKNADGSLNVQQVVDRKKHLQAHIDFPWKVYLLQDGQMLRVDGNMIEYLGQNAIKEPI